jgi:hypothetical protein
MPCGRESSGHPIFFKYTLVLSHQVIRINFFPVLILVTKHDMELYLSTPALHNRMLMSWGYCVNSSVFA